MKKILIAIIFLIFNLALTNSAIAATITWTNGDAGDDKASTAGNWDSGEAPQDGDRVVFNATTDDCTWDLNVALNALTVTSGYTGKITKVTGVELIISANQTWTGDAVGDDSASNPDNWSNNAVPQDGDRIIFNDTSPDNCIWDINISPSLFSTSSAYSGTVTFNENITINGNITVNGGTLNLNNKDLTVNGYLLIGINGTLNATSSAIEVKGDWANWGNFIPGNSTVTLSGTGQTIYGDTTFYNLIKTVTAADTLYFEAGSAQTIANSLTLQGANGNLLSLRSKSFSSFWYIDPQGARNITYVNIQDMNNTNFVNIIPTNSEDAGNNSGVSFGGSECVCRKDGFLLAQVLCEKGRGTC